MAIQNNDVYTTSDTTSDMQILNSQYTDYKEKRYLQLHKLSHEHNQCIFFTEKIAEIAETTDTEQLSKGMELVQKYNDTELEAHFRHEEQTILALLVQYHTEHMELCITLGREHGFIRTIVENMTLETAQQDLADFAQIMKHHTHEEETKLFPIVESLFTQEQLNAVVNYKPWH